MRRARPFAKLPCSCVARRTYSCFRLLPTTCLCRIAVARISGRGAQCRPDRFHEACTVQRLLEVARTVTSGELREVFFLPAGDQYHGKVRALDAHFFEQLDPADSWHSHIGNQAVDDV